MLKPKKKYCLICTKKKKNMLVIEPCNHLVCFDCLSVWIATHEMNCPICRTNIKCAYGKEKNGEIKRKIILQNPPEIDYGSYSPPKGTDEWQKKLARLWNYIPKRVWIVLFQYGVENQIIYSLIMKILSTKSKTDAKHEIDKLIGAIIPSFTDQLLDFEIPAPKVVEDEDDDYPSN
ncbi:hypothetical protein TVAG_351570 [Trichomonas vaginalis G3]|uniref:RING-type domain-containing protein n=1 Tax=Trichomonas vaginalis (strain ATCC PRA-98 / G3) TaxID=412133 RepID=A2DZP1_TRIV3|nr:ubiquitin protein ligase activity family [Trichomonas vaginalis G3]EAY14109.1 hypothetical protein TVAG_351570 [Trichomonas vaginalis G3]KAI5525118.1 ubiquitin protein ligase activity family [Trichomonas vaginalis G3]|eukprot:XP_001326332.1 hypothetical protein [Trichomonas vaginalis G3]